MLKAYSQKSVTAFLTVLLIGTGITPFIQANNLGTPIWLYLYLAVISGIAVVNLKWFIEVPLQLLSLLVICYRYFPSNQPFSFRWGKYFIQNALTYLDPVRRAEFQFLPSDLALIFIVLFLMMLVKLIINYELWMLPFLAVLSYLLILTVFNGTDHFGEIVRLLVISVLLSVWLGPKGEVNRASWRHQGWVIAALSFSLLVAWQLPVWLPEVHQGLQMQTQPLRSKIRSKSFYRLIEFARGNGLSGTTGFSENDSVLGGSIIPNDELVFLAQQTAAHYWKVENKDRYSGRGWESSKTDHQVIEQQTVVFDEGHTRYQEKGSPIELTLPNPIRYVPKPQGMISWTLPTSYLENQNLEYAPEHNRLYVNLSADYPAESTLKFEYFAPDYSLADLERSHARGAIEGDETYLQLPKALPARVGELARQLTADSETDYQALKAIESYLKNTADFRYSMEDAEVVPEKRDYVDFFLFDSQVGYCEHFSSAMVVLARTLGIPARWAKGFSEGQATGTNDDGTKTYRITNENAHAWPEIHFQGVGWVPFEPTKSFVSSEQVALSTITPGATQDTPSSPEEPLPSSASLEQKPEVSTSSDQKADNVTGEIEEEKESNQLGKMVQLVLMGVGGICGIAALIFRRQVRWLWWLWKVRYYPPYTFVQAYDGMVRLLELELGRQPSETIRQFQYRLTSQSPEGESIFKGLTDTYEQLIYGAHTSPERRLTEMEQQAFSQIKQLLQQGSK